jgi:hypothetical protein
MYGSDSGGDQDVEANDVRGQNRLDGDAGATGSSGAHSGVILGQCPRTLASMSGNRCFERGSDSLDRSLKQTLARDGSEITTRGVFEQSSHFVVDKDWFDRGGLPCECGGFLRQQQALPLAADSKLKA